jgi:hypothetical protein
MVASDTLTLIVDDQVEASRAPVPSRFGERIAFGHFYQTLIQVDCSGQVRPGLAAAWQADEDGSLWRFELSQEAVFSDGSRVTAAAVAASWSRDAVRGPQPWAGTIEESVIVLGDRTLAVKLDRRHATVPPIFAHPGLAVRGQALDDGGWPVGSGPFVPIRTTAGSVSARVSGAMGRDAIGTLLMRWAGPDPRDAIDQGFDVVVTRRPAVSAYASADGTARVLPLAWDRVYVLVVPARRAQPSAFVTVPLAEDLAAAALGADARKSPGRYWWDDVTCPLPATVHETTRSPVRRIVYRKDDAVGRGLAERFVALVASGLLVQVVGEEASGPRPVAVGLEPGVFAEALRVGADLGYVLHIDRAVLDGCQAARSLVRAAPWPARLVPLVDTRAHLVIRRLSDRVVVAWDGAPFLAAAESAP